MNNDTGLTAAGRKYAAAQAAYHVQKDLYAALELHRGVFAAHLTTDEAEHSRTQMHNIVKGVIPKDDLLTAQVEQALACLELVGPRETGAAALTPLASELPS